MASPQSRAPYPYDFRITINSVTYSLMLTRSKTDGIGWTEQRVNYFPSPAVSAESIDYTRYPPEDEMVYLQTDFSGGVGQATQPDGNPNRYAWAEHVDCSSGEAALATAGTETTSAIAIPTATEYTRPHAVVFGTNVVYFAIYRYLYKWDGTTLTQVLDVGAANVIGQMAVFSGNYNPPLLWVPIIVISGAKGTFYKTTSDGSTFVTSTNWKPTCFKVIGNELWGAFYDTTTFTWGIRKTEAGADGANNDTSTTFGAQTIVGDPVNRIQWLAGAQNRLYVLKEDGLYAPSLDATAVDEHLTPGWESMATHQSGSWSIHAGEGAITFDENVVFPMAGGLHRYDPLSGELEQFGPELLDFPFPMLYDTTVAHTMAALTGSALFLIVPFTVDGVEEFHLLRYGGWGRDDQGELIRRAVWHGSLYQFALAAQPYCMYVGASGANIQLLIIHRGTADANTLSVTRILLPKTQSPIGDSDISAYYAGTHAYLYLPRMYGALPFETKLWSAVGLKGRNCYYTDASNYNILAPEYKVTSTPFVTTGYSAVNSTAATNEVRADPGKRIEASSNVSAQAIDVRINLTKSGSLTNAKSTPVLSAVAAVQKLRLAGIKEMTATVQLADEVSLRDSSTSRNQWEEVKTALERAGNADSSNLENTPLTAVTPFGETVTVFVKNFGVKILDTDDRGDWKSAFFLRMVEVR